MTCIQLLQLLNPNHFCLLLLSPLKNDKLTFFLASTQLKSEWRLTPLASAEVRETSLFLHKGQHLFSDGLTKLLQF